MPTHRVRRRPITRSDGDEYEPGDEIEPTDAELEAFGDNLVPIENEESDAEAGAEEDDLDDAELGDVLAGTVDEVAAALATGEYDAVLDELAALEADGEDRTGVLDAIDDRREDGDGE